MLAGIAASFDHEPVLTLRADRPAARTGRPPLLLEVELTEPSLFLQHAPQSAVRRWAMHLAQLVAEDG